MRVRLKLVHWMLAVAVCGVALFGYSCLKKRAYFAQESLKHKSRSQACQAGIQNIRGLIDRGNQNKLRNPTATFDDSFPQEYEQQITELTQKRKYEEDNDAIL